MNREGAVPQDWPLAVFDWGSTNLRGYLVDEAGDILKHVGRPDGVRNIDRAAIPTVFEALLADLAGGSPLRDVLLVGMIGSDLGWRPVPMIPAPGSIACFAAGLATLEFARRPRISVVPGLSAPSWNGTISMMRGEETQALGALAIAGAEDALLCLPGTHTKWVRAGEGRLENVITAMSGEVFDLLEKHSTLRSTVAAAGGAMDLAAFDTGLDEAASGSGILLLVFSIRSEAILSGRTDAVEARSRLSGIIIGSEVEALMRCVGMPRTPVLIVGEESLSALYGRALSRYGASWRAIEGDRAVARGAAQIHRHRLCLQSA
jgi:2-dehydro-3-deoxygalactonokinase